MTAAMPAFVPVSRLLVCDRPADHPVACGPRGVVRWSQFRRDVGALAARLKSAGGNRWLIATDDAYALAVALLSVLQADGRAWLPANLQAGHLAELAHAADAVLVQEGELSPAGRAMAIFDRHVGDASWCFRSIDPVTALIQLHTSGTTARPEPIVKPLRCLETEVSVLEKVFRPQDAQTVLATVPAFHIYGLLFRVLWPLAAGRPFETAAIAFPEELMTLAQQRPAPLLVSSPAFLRRALARLDLARLSGNLCGAFSSGGPLDPEVAAAYNAALDCGVVEVYGSTETGGIGHRLVRDPADPPAWTPFPGIAVKRCGGEGTIAVESPYLAEPGPFETGDRGTVFPDGRFRLEGRKDRIVKLEERRISLLEIEDRLKSCPEVGDARVLTLESAHARTALGAVVVPSEAGWNLLVAGGKRGLRERLHNALKPHVEALALPRRWRFVRRLPETAQGKTTAADLTALFLPACARTVEPELVLSPAGDGRVEVDLTLQEQLVYFDGHFDAAAILPGVVQVDWAVKQARRCFAIPGSFHRIEALKFFQVLPAGAQVTLILEFDASKARLSFSYQAGDVTHSSGRVRFEAK